MTGMRIENMTISEKLSAMETLWNDLCANSQIASPDWHEEVLTKRHQLRNKAEQQPMDWSEAKEAIRQRIR
jgi:hypothetical protein